MLVLLPVMSINSMLPFQSTGDLRELFIASEWHGECSHSRRPCQNNARSKYVTQICRFYSDYMRSRILRIANRYESWDGNVRLPWTRRKWAWAGVFRHDFIHSWRNMDHSAEFLCRTTADIGWKVLFFTNQLGGSAWAAIIKNTQLWFLPYLATARRAEQAWVSLLQRSMFMPHKNNGD